jgi:hypothetical protein
MVCRPATDCIQFAAGLSRCLPAQIGAHVHSHLSLPPPFWLPPLPRPTRRWGRRRPWPPQQGRRPSHRRSGDPWLPPQLRLRLLAPARAALPCGSGRRPPPGHGAGGNGNYERRRAGRPLHDPRPAVRAASAVQARKRHGVLGSCRARAPVSCLCTQRTVVRHRNAQRVQRAGEQMISKEECLTVAGFPLRAQTSARRASQCSPKLCRAMGGNSGRLDGFKLKSGLRYCRAAVLQPGLRPGRSGTAGGSGRRAGCARGGAAREAGGSNRPGRPWPEGPPRKWG